jgi:hypothetical protein
MKSKCIKGFPFAFAWCFTASLGIAQTTNIIPPNIFLTDDGKVFWYKPGQRFVAVSAIEAAKKLPESRPVDQDPEGNWGAATNGFQLSLRLEKRKFTVGNPIVVTTLVRNISTNTQSYLGPVMIHVLKGGKTVQRISPIMEITVSPEVSLFPQTQRKNEETLDQIFKLSEPGEYVLQAECRQPKVTSKPIIIVIGP